MSVEVKLLFFDGGLHSDSIDDILLRSILDTNETQSQVYIFSLNHTLGIGSTVHDINLGDDTNCSDALGVELSSHLETIRCGHICICG